MAFDTFIKVEGIEGESSDARHVGWIEAFNFKIALGQKASATASSAGGATAERADFQPLYFTMPMDRSSPKLAQACADGTHIDEVLVEVCRAGGDRVAFMTYRLRNCIIKKVFTIGDGNFPMESVTIDYGRIQWAYTRQNRSGGGSSGQVATGWNREKNCRL